MFSLGDRAGDVLTTVALFLLTAVILYAARGAFLIMLLSLFLAYLLEPWEAKWEASPAYTSRYLQSPLSESCGWSVSRAGTPRLLTPITRS